MPWNMVNLAIYLELLLQVRPCMHCIPIFVLQMVFQNWRKFIDVKFLHTYTLWKLSRVITGLVEPKTWFTWRIRQQKLWGKKLRWEGQCNVFGTSKVPPCFFIENLIFFMLSMHICNFSVTFLSIKIWLNHSRAIESLAIVTIPIACYVFLLRRMCFF